MVNIGQQWTRVVTMLGNCPNPHAANLSLFGPKLNINCHKYENDINIDMSAALY